MTSKPECTHEGAAPLAGATRPDEQQHQQSATVKPGVGHPASQSLPTDEPDFYETKGALDPKEARAGETK